MSTLVTFLARLFNYFDCDPNRTEAISYTLPYPPTANTFWRFVPGKKTPILSNDARLYIRAVAKIVGNQPPRFTGRLSLTVVSFQPDRRARDLDNLLQAIQDSLTRAGVWSDDACIDHLHVKREGIDVHDPRVEVFIHQIVRTTEF